MCHHHFESLHAKNYISFKVSIGILVGSDWYCFLTITFALLCLVPRYTYPPNRHCHERHVACTVIGCVLTQSSLRLASLDDFTNFASIQPVELFRNKTTLSFVRQSHPISMYKPQPLKACFLTKHANTIKTKAALRP